MGRRVVITHKQVEEKVNSIKAMGFTISGIEFHHDGTLTILTAAVDRSLEPAKDDRKPEPWT